MVRFDNVKYSPEEVFSFLDETIAKREGETGKRVSYRERAIFHGANVSIRSQRYSLFKRSIVCEKCGIKGMCFIIEADHLSAERNIWHFNLYGINKNGNEVLFTKDHIIPKSKGGPDLQENYQTMCIHCNNKKGDKI